MKKMMMTLAAVLCCAMTTTVVNAQEAESPIQKRERLVMAADDAPQDWKKQYDAAEFYLNESNGTPNTILAEKYATRALEIAQSQTVKRDTILGKTLELMTTLGMYNKNFEQMIGSYDQAIRAYVDELGYQNAAIPPRIAFLASLKWMLHSSGLTSMVMLMQSKLYVRHLFSTINCQRDNELKEWRMLRQYMPYRMRC